MPRRTLGLSAAQRAELEAVRDHDRRPYLRECAAALLKIAEGACAHQVARNGLHKPRDPDTIYRWVTIYERDGLDGLVHRPRGHRGFSPCADRDGRRGNPAGTVHLRTGAQSLAAD